MEEAEMSDERRIDIEEDHDAHGGYILRGGGQVAPTLIELAKKLGVRDDQLVLHLNPKLAKRQRNRDEVARNQDAWKEDF
jgi:hypothetical protein